MRIIILILCCVRGNYGENRNAVSVQERSTIVVTFNISINQKEAHCKSSELIVEEGTIVKFNANRINIPRELIPNQNYHSTTEVQKVKCTYKNGQHALGEEYEYDVSNHPWEEEHTITKDMYGVWRCEIMFNDNGIFGDLKLMNPQGAVSYSYVNCSITVKKPGMKEGVKVYADGVAGRKLVYKNCSFKDIRYYPTTPVPAVSGQQTDTINTEIWYIIGGVGIVVLLIIVGQTIALCYFKRKAQPRRRMDGMTTRSRFDRGDQARYSAPPCKKRKSSVRAEADTDSHIYEMVGVNALYNKSSELNPEANTDIAEKNIRGRPPLPLPYENSKPVPAETLPRNKASPMKSMPSTLSLNSTNSSSLLNKKGKELPPTTGQIFKKAPARPPKQIDEDSIPGSLRRSAMSAATSAKTGTLPKAPSTKSPMSELKKIFKNRNVGNDTIPSPVATLERKEVKASTQTQRQPPNISTKPIVTQQNQIKLILPKIEASLKSPKPLVPKEPIQSPQPPEKPSRVVSPKKNPVSLNPVTQPDPKSVQKRSLPTPESARKLPPEPEPIPVPSLPPIYQAADEDVTPDTDDEEWTYEQLEKYNIYNI